MEQQRIKLGERSLPYYRFGTVVIGTGAAGYNAALRLNQYGERDIAIVTDFVNAGTSRNTGSDKQTYYKLTLSGGDPDSVGEMAQTLFAGGSMDGDTALVEAALSAQSFYHLVEAGVPFPRNRYGEYIGYKTDHDPRRRATSIGPYTSKRMTECLEEKVQEAGILTLDRLQVIRLLRDDERIQGLLCYSTGDVTDEDRFVLIQAANVVQATGGPAAIYADSVYPHGHYGANGLAFEVGAKGQNLTEWQYGLASIRPRWNVSGTYMQVLPRLVSTAEDGSDETEFLLDFFSDREEALSLLFLKGYQWPFDVSKVRDGSSIIDILVHIETTKGRRVFLDYRSNPGATEPNYEGLSAEAYDYLRQAGACFGTPFERLMHMNEPAVSFYRDRGVDLETEMLEIALSAQHNNGGIAVDHWWQTSVPGLYAVGEAAGTHGVYRPGGSALNSGQVGSTRAALHIASRPAVEMADKLSFGKQISEEVLRLIELSRHVVEDSAADEVETIRARAAKRMSYSGAAIRKADEILRILDEARTDLERVDSGQVCVQKRGAAKLYRLRDMLQSQMLYLSAMADYIAVGGKSRGSSLYSDPEGEAASPKLDDRFRFTLDDGLLSKQIQETNLLANKEIAHTWRAVRPIPEDDDFFENIWRDYREHGNVY